VQRDYVFGWLISGLYQASSLAGVLTLKGGNALRKAYFPATRFSDDLDFTTEQGLVAGQLLSEFNNICKFVEEHSGVHFDLDRNQIADVQRIDQAKQVFKLRLYFKDFAGAPDHITLKVKLDVTEHDRLYLPVQTRRLIHQFSDANACNSEIRCIKLEEALADKLKCLIQRRYCFDLFDLVYGIFIKHELEVDRTELVNVFLRKTIFEHSPVAAKNLLLGIPLDLFRGFWGKVVCPAASRMTFEHAVSLLTSGIETLFAAFHYGVVLVPAFFPAELRNPIMQAGKDLKIMRLTYHGISREVEPYRLAFKERRDGLAQEYLYAWDRTGGKSGKIGIKTFLQGGVQHIEITDQTFEPRFEVELSKAGDRSTPAFISRPFRRGPRYPDMRTEFPPRYTIMCRYCGRHFSRITLSTTLRPHKDDYGNECFGRIGIRVD
jgi:predicted nucleotidyltransferase component of viral defense system